MDENNKGSKKGKYDHVESKVLQYRKQIQQQNQEHYEKKNFKKVCNIAMQEMIQINLNNETSVYEEPEKDEEIKLLTEENRKLLTKNGELEVKVDYLRFEVARLKSLAQLHSSDLEKTPNLNNRTLNQSPFKVSNIFRTPIRSISNSLLRNSKNCLVNNSITIQDVEVSETDSSLSDDGEINELRTETYTTLPVFPSKHVDLSRNSNQPLLKKEENHNLRSRIRNFLNTLTCPNIHIHTNNNGTKKRWLKIVKKNNHVHPENCAKTPERKITWSKTGNNEIPLIIIRTPNDRNSHRKSLKFLRENENSQTKAVVGKSSTQHRCSDSIKSDKSTHTAHLASDKELALSLLPHVEQILESAGKIKEIANNLKT